MAPSPTSTLLCLLPRMHQRVVLLTFTVLSLDIDNCKTCDNRTSPDGGKYGIRESEWIEEVSILFTDAMLLWYLPRS